MKGWQCYRTDSCCFLTEGDKTPFLATALRARTKIRSYLNIFYCLLKRWVGQMGQRGPILADSVPKNTGENTPDVPVPIIQNMFLFVLQTSEPLNSFFFHTTHSPLAFRRAPRNPTQVLRTIQFRLRAVPATMQITDPNENQRAQHPQEGKSMCWGDVGHVELPTGWRW